ncbi:hypothetical protein Q5H91_02315 [Sphingomonas sp. KR1UV-12]|uniref:Phage shock protein B n=1 Tax=Sphingomonas aurea TaxID=3063994 RepID=A0ABT9EGQ7_9SPHN|nr:hypothetical protein [Sphingomonas sp. KR1UV-12]MDP1026032.1 hypothetical protein [Sphingomonas sp. KR1UV-12]
MNPFSMVVAIILIVSVSKIISRYLTAKAHSQGNAVQSADAMRAQDEVRQLKERVAVLERVITDNHGSLGLDREIERLRDR